MPEEEIDYDALFAEMETAEEVLQEGENDIACPDCGSRSLVTDERKGEVSCNECGVILDDEQIEEGAPTRRFSKDDPTVDNSHHGAPMSILFPDKGLTTTFNPWEGGAKGENRATQFKMKKINDRLKSNKERSLTGALGDLARTVSRMGLPKQVQEAAAQIYRDAVDAQLIRGRSIEGVVAASIYAACRVCKVPRTLDEVAAGARCGRKEIGRNYTTLMSKLTQLKQKVGIPSAEDFIPRYCTQLKLSSAVQNKAISLVNMCYSDGGAQGKNPSGVAAAAIYIASIRMDERRTQREIAEECDITEVTIRNRYKEMMARLTEIEG